MKNRVPARVLLSYTTDYLWDHLEGDFILVMDDGEIETNEKEVLYSSYVWDYHRRFPNTPLLLKHHVKAIIKDDPSGTDTHLDLINSVLWSFVEAYRPDFINIEELIDIGALMSYEVSNTMYNDLTYRLEPDVTTLDILDFIQFTKHPRLVKAIEQMENTDEGVAKVNNVVLELSKSAEFKNNAMASVMRSKIVSEGQALQCLAPLGFRTDIDSDIFTRAIIKRGFTQGLSSLRDSMVESRSAAKALIFSTDPLQKSEYFSRRQQLICQNVRHLHRGDCGSTHYVPWLIREERMDNATKLASDLKTLAGKYYLDEGTNTLKILKESDKHLIGTTLKLRSAVAGCNHPDPYGICEVCYGATSLAIPANTNLGHITCVAMMSVLGQLILSTKHFEGSSAVEGIALKAHERIYLSAVVNGSRYYLNERLMSCKVKLVVAASQVPGLTDISLVDDIETLNISRISDFDTILLMVEDSTGIETIPLTVSVNGRLSNMTHELLKHIKRVGWTVTKNDNYIIDMAGWNFADPILVLPMRHFNMSDHQQEIADMLEATIKDLDYRSNVVNPCNMLVEFHDLVNRRLSINLAILEIILYSSMVVSATEEDYGLPKPWTSSGVGVKQLLLTRRSLSTTMGFERHRDVLTDPLSYTLTNRMDHIMDPLIMPELLNKL